MIIVKIFALILILVGVVFCYDARILSGAWFSFGDQNEATSRIKNSWFYFCYSRCNYYVCYKIKTEV